MDRPTVINYVISKHNLQKYLEIGIEGDAGNWRAIEAPFKYSIDITRNPYAMQMVSSDTFFYQLNHTFDFIFIDGDHHSNQVDRDIQNSLNFISDDGFILCHDTCPHEEGMQIVPREQAGWCGDVWKSILRLRKSSDIYVQTLESDFGLTIIRKNKTMPKFELDIEETWENYVKCRNNFLNIKDWESFKKGLD
jgi:hypothetical protein